MNVRIIQITMLAFVVVCSTNIERAAGGIKLITLPIRERVEIQLDHPHVTLVEEERMVPLAAGVNDVVFAWANAAIDKNSIQFSCLTDPGNIRVLSVSYPPNENALTWQVSSPNAGSARVRISYVIGGLDKTFAYRAVASNDEETLTLWQYVRLHNHANEAFGQAGMWAGFGERFERPIDINETRQLLSAKFEDVPIEKTYTADLSAHGYLNEGKRQLRIPMHYVLKNDRDHGLGRFPLMFGKARIFQDDGRGTVAFLGEDWGTFTPLNDEMRLYLGLSKDIVVKRTIESRKAIHVLGNLYHYDVVVKYEIENFKDQRVVLDIVESLPDLRREILRDTRRDVEWQLKNTGTLDEMIDREKSNADQVVFHVTLPQRGEDQKAVKQIHKMNVLIKNEW
ncbi:MAG: DUF4139 domain-containing protein [Phycisphaerales bacterium]|nr:DUF4139 domain-containing protein [Phycisphaerales bacterium]